MKALVTGGTGTLGRLVVPRLRDAGGDIRVLSRHHPELTEGIEYVTGDLATGEGIDAAVSGTEIIVHCAGSAKGDEDKARHLVRAASRSGTRHLVNISVVGADRIPVAGRLDRAMFSYFSSKLAAEQWWLLGAPVDDAACDPVPRLDLHGGPATGQAACRTGCFWFQVPADRCGRCRGSTRCPRTGCAVRAGARHRRAARVRDGRPGPDVPAGQWQTSGAPADMAPRQGRGGPPSWRGPRPGTGRGPSNVGRLPR